MTHALKRCSKEFSVSMRRGNPVLRHCGCPFVTSLLGDALECVILSEGVRPHNEIGANIEAELPGGRQRGRNLRRQ